MKVDLGRRIKFFRKRAGMTQIDLELEAGMAMGSVSRIESNVINPTKETILSIAKVLELNTFEVDYLIGRTAIPADNYEVEKAKEEVNEELNKIGKLNYLLDERWRFHQISERFIKLLGLSASDLDYVIGKTTAQLIVREDSPIIRSLDKDHYEELLNEYMSIYFSNLSYMDDDEIFQNTLRDINENKIARPIWNRLVQENDRKYTSNDTMNIYFDINGKKFHLYYTWQPLLVNDRFVIVDFRTEDRLNEVILDLI